MKAIQRKISKIAIASMTTLACMFGFAACGPGSSTASHGSDEAVSTKIGSEKVEVTLWDGAGLKSYDDALIKAFEKKYPNVTIKATYDPDNTSAQNGPRIISAADTPDIARITDINSAVRGKHLVNLEAYGKAYKWNIPSSQTQVYRVDKSGKIGSGDLYAVPDGVSLTGLYWNKAVASKLGISQAPSTVAELEQDMKEAKDAGVLPMVMPAKEGGTSYLFQALITNYEGRDTVQNWIIQKDGATFKTSGALKAASMIQKWQKAGYFSSDALALDGSTALSSFCRGGGLFFPSGSWYSASINKALGKDSGFIAYPGEKAGQGSAAANAVTAFGIPQNAKHKNVAAAFLNFLLSDQARQIAVDNGYPPVGEGKTPHSDNQLLGQILVAYEQLVKTGNTTDYINNATAGMQASGIIPGFQSLLDGSMSPEQFVNSIQAQYEKETK